MILRNIKCPTLVNGKRAIITALLPNLIEAKISTGEYKDELIILPRIRFNTDSDENSITFTRL